MDLHYHNFGTSPITFGIATFALARGAEQAELLQVDDMTGVNLSDQDPNNDDPRPLFNSNGKVRTVPLILQPGETRNVEVTFANFQTDKGTEGDQSLSSTIAMPSGTVPLRFKTKYD